MCVCFNREIRLRKCRELSSTQNTENVRMRIDWVVGRNRGNTRRFIRIFEVFKIQAISALNVKLVMGGKKKQTRNEDSGSDERSQQKEIDIRLIPEYSGEGKVSEWLDKVELICSLRGINDLTEVIPLRLSGDAFAVYQQLPAVDKRSTEKVRAALLTAFADDAFVAYSKFVHRELKMNEPADVFLADLRRLSGLFGGMSDQGLACAFVAGLPEAARQTLRASCRVESLQLTQLLSRARAVLTDANYATSAGAMAQDPTAAPGGASRGPSNRPPSVLGGPVRCFTCDGPNHLARDCLQRREALQTRRQRVKCFRCGGNHFARACRGNEEGEAGSAPASSPGTQ